MGRWGRSLWSLANAGAYCRGFSRADPDSSSGEAGRNGRAGRDHALPGHPPRVSRALGRVLRGGCGASLSLPGHLGSVGPANGTRPVGLGGSSLMSRLHSCPTPIPSEALLLPDGDLAPCVEPKTSGCQRGRREKPSSPPPPSPHLGASMGTLPSTTCRHTWCGTHGCRGGPGAAAAPQNH